MKYKKLKIVGLKKITKVGITLILVLVGIILYHFLGVLGHYVLEKTSVNIFILVGWFLLIVGEFMFIYVIWEK